MTIIMNDSPIVSIKQIEEFLKLEGKIKFRAVSKKEKYQWFQETLAKFRYFGLNKKEKGVVRKYLGQMTGLSKSQTTKLVARKKKTGMVWLGSTKRHCFARKYFPEDTALLVETDNLHSRLSGPATRKIFERMSGLFGDKRFERLKNISVSHLYNLRDTRQYQSHSLTIRKTTPVKILIGQRRKPEPEGKPGFLRVDSVHQGDLDKEKGVYHINLVDQITQWEVLGSVERISEHYLAPLLESLILQYPFKILGFHSDNGSEFINKIIAQLLNKLLIQQTKSRARRANDNALVESKNGSVVRKHIGYQFIPRGQASLINQFYQEWFNPYLNFHRPCGFAQTITDKKGKQKKVYNLYQTPYERLRSLANAKEYLKPGITFEALDKIAYQRSDNEFAGLMQKAKDELFNKFKGQKLQFPTVFTTFISGSYVD